MTRDVVRSAGLVAVGCFGLFLGCAERSPALLVPQTRVIETRSLTIDRIYPSMTGPSDRVDIDPQDLDWIVAIRNAVVDSETGDALGGEFFCHSQVQARKNTRLAVAATGIDELRFPPGFGIHLGGLTAGIPEPARRLTYFGMLLNNHEPSMLRDVRVQATVEYLTDEQVGTPPRLKRLYSGQLAMTVEDLTGTSEPEPPLDDDADSTHCALVDGRPAHWIVPPGEQATRDVFRAIVPVESTVHLVQAHLHNHGEWVRLTDRTTGEVIWQTSAEYEPDRRQIANIPQYSSTEGFRIYPDREYQLDAFYDNTSGEDVDAMAVVYLYFHPVDDSELQLSAPDSGS